MISLKRTILLTLLSMGLMVANAANAVKGTQGPAGEKEATGETKEAGETGPQGPIGLTGDTGPAGPQGTIGLTGPAGPVSTVAGPIGPASTVAGPQGTIGLTGPEGPVSTVAGPAGPAGPVSTVAGPAGTTIADGTHKGDILEWNGTAWTSVAAAPVFNLGDTGPDGGKVFFVDGSGQHGLEAQLTDAALGVRIDWSTAISTAAAYNTTTKTIALSCSTTNAQLAPHCWHLPTKTELNLLWEQKNVVGGFSYITYYWSSSILEDSTIASAWVAFFTSGIQDYTHYSNPLYLARAVRTF